MAWTADLSANSGLVSRPRLLCMLARAAGDDAHDSVTYLGYGRRAGQCLSESVFNIRHVTRRLKIIDLFAGCGGMTAGFKPHGFDPVLSVELNLQAAATYAANFGEDHTFWGDI